MSKKIFKYIPLSFIISALITLASYIVLRLSVNSADFADKVDAALGSKLRFAFGSISDLFPFSLFEVIIALIPIFIALVIFLSVRAFKRGKKCKFLLRIIAFVGIIYSLFIFTMGIAYRKAPLEDKMSLRATDEISAEELYETLELILPELNSLAEKVKFRAGESRMEYSFDELSEKLSAAYTALSEKYSFFDSISYSRAKPILFSEVMSYFRITGIYTFYTGEANINTAYPDYNLPFTVAHEFAHRRGVLREDEANFTAFLVCISSDDDFIRYSGYLNMYEYLISALYRTDKELWLDAAKRLNSHSNSDIQASNAVSQKYADTVIGDISNSVNDLYLKGNGTEGRVSYGLVTRLAVAYYKK